LIDQTMIKRFKTDTDSLVLHETRAPIIYKRKKLLLAPITIDGGV